MDRPVMFRVTARLLQQATRMLRDRDATIIRLQHEKRAAELAYMRISRDLIEQFLIALDQPEAHDTIRTRLATSLDAYRDEIAILEEHV